MNAFQTQTRQSFCETDIHTDSFAGGEAVKFTCQRKPGKQTTTIKHIVWLPHSLHIYF